MIVITIVGKRINYNVGPTVTAKDSNGNRLKILSPKTLGKL